MAYTRKTKDEYEIQQHWGHGWEPVNCEETRTDARRSLREYRENQPGVPTRCVKKRVRLGVVR